jgi:hypothetical protein
MASIKSDKSIVSRVGPHSGAREVGASQALAPLKSVIIGMKGMLKTPEVRCLMDLLKLTDTAVVCTRFAYDLKAQGYRPGFGVYQGPGVVLTGNGFRVAIHSTLTQSGTAEPGAVIPYKSPGVFASRKVSATLRKVMLEINTGSDVGRTSANLTAPITIETIVARINMARQYFSRVRASERAGSLIDGKNETVTGTVYGAVSA